jgi:hypothetical protein
MKNCKDIENSLPLYTEDLLSADEKKAVEEHLAECVDCSEALADLKKVAAITQKLTAIEPSPWFKQKIMARVREEAEKKSFAQKWFYPLRIKIPVQIMATIVIAVLAVYIYRSSDEQMNVVLPGAQQPVMEAKQEPKLAEIPKAKSAALAPLVEKKAEVIGRANKDKISEEISSGGSVPKMEMRENKPADTSDKSLTMKSNIAVGKEEKKYTELPAKQESMRERSVEDSSLSGAVKKSKSLKAAAPAAQRSMAASVTTELQTGISVYVADVSSAVVEVEKILIKHDARKVTKRLIDGKAILQAELPAKNLKDVLSQLRTIGQVEEKTVPAESGERDINVVIEIKNR